MRPNKASLALLLAVALLPAAALAQPLVEGFDSGVPAGWVVTNKSVPLGVTSWFAGNTAVFGAQATTGYIAANFNATTDTGIVSDWLISPALTNLQNGQRLTFYARAESGAPAADELQVLACVGDDTVCTVVASEPGGFTVPLLDLNPLPTTWTLQGVTLTGLPAGVNTGRIAFRHMASNSGPGPLATGGDYVGVDSVTFLAALPALAITKTVSNQVPNVGDVFDYQVVVSNTGGADASAVVITDDVPAGLTIGTVTITPTGSCGLVGQLVTCNVPILSAGSSVTVTIPVTATANGTYINTASASGAALPAVAASALAQAGTATIPTLKFWGLALLGLAIGLGGLFALGRTR